MSTSGPTAVLVLAAGEGTRMRSDTPKVLHEIGGRSLLGHAIAAARGVDPAHLVVVVRHERDRVAGHLADIAPDAILADQDEIKGTGRAAECGLSALPGGVDSLAGTILVTYGDVPLLEAPTLHHLVDLHDTSGSAVTVLTATVADPTGYGRVLRDESGAVAGIVEQKDATAVQREIREINSGIYAFDAAFLVSALGRVGTDNAQGEKYLTDVVGLARADGRLVTAHLVDDLWQTEGVNDRVQLAALGAELNRRVVDRLMRAGVTVVDPASTRIDVQAQVDRDTRLLPGTQLVGATSVGSRCVVGPDSTLTDSSVADESVVVRCHAVGAVIGARAQVGPFVALGPGAHVGDGERLGPFEARDGRTAR